MDGTHPFTDETEPDRPVRATGEQVDDLPPDGRLARLVDAFVKNVAKADQLRSEGIERQCLAHLDPDNGVRPASAGGQSLEQGVDRRDDKTTGLRRRLIQPP